MNDLNLADVYEYVSENVEQFHANRLKKLEDLGLNDLLRRKNPYLFKAKNVLTAEMLIRGILDAHLSSQEETIFGDFLEGVAIFVCGQVFGGHNKPSTNDIEGIDLIFERDNRVYIVEIKSGPHWGNSSQIKKMMQNFYAAIDNLANQYSNQEIIPINGCLYGKDNRPYKQRADGSYWKLCGQDFWSFISGNEALYTQIIEPLGYEAKQRTETFDREYARVINRLTVNFAKKYCTNEGDIIWDEITRFVSRRTEKSPFHEVDNVDLG